jgi:GNAT superfamily N-acetyltransferase
MEINYRNATVEDIVFLVESRLNFIHAIKTDVDYELLKGNIHHYFEKGFKEKQFDIVLAEHDNSIIGTGIIFYYDSVPSIFNPWGKNSYITSMFVDENYRRCGIATTILDKLIQIAKVKGYHVFILNESEMGRPVYEKYGFHDGRKGMILKL